MKPIATTIEMRARFESYLASDRAESLRTSLVRLLEDPLRPRTKDGRFRPNPILLLIGVLIAFGSYTLFYFSFGGL